jgi:S-formylglutathione hydrolase FrmB
MKKFLFVSALLFISHIASAYKQKEVFVYSESMSKDVPVTVITPDSYRKGKAFPVVYLLHGYSDNHTKWADGDHVGKLADLHDVVVVMPDAGYSSWYFDSPVMPEYKYETFIVKELISYVDKHYKTISDRKGRAITGLSMGGHGALYLSIRHQDLFASAGSLSGGVDIRPFPGKWHIAKRLGTIEEHPENWENNTVINMIHLLEPGSLNIVFECGTDDIFYGVNCNLHEKLLEAKIPHEFYSRPGGHNWPYWFNAIKYQFLFFNDRFVRP